MTVSDLSISVHLIEAALWLPASHSCCHDCPAMMGCTPNCDCPARMGYTTNCDCPAIMGCTPNCDCPAWWAVPQTVTVCVFACSCMMQAHGIQRIAFGFIFFRHLLLFIWNKVFHWPGTSPSRSGEPTICLCLPSHRYRDAKCAWLLTQILGHILYLRVKHFLSCLVRYPLLWIVLTDSLAL